MMGGLFASRRRRVAIAVGLVLVLLFGFSRWMLRTTPVTADDAIEAFREQKAGAAAMHSADPQEPGAPHTALRPAAEPGPITVVSTGRDATRGALVRPIRFRPAEGTYAYDAEGEEGVPGYRRDLGGRTFRNVVHFGPDAWQEHHLFRKQRQSWTTYGQDEQGRFVTSARNYIGFGEPELVTLDETVTFDPALRGAVLPWREGRRWQGAFEGDTYGTYTAGTVEHGWMRVDGERIEFWRDRLSIELRGDLQGTVIVERWISPRHGIVLREEYDATAEKGPITYTAHWSVTLRSLEPID